MRIFLKNYQLFFFLLATVFVGCDSNEVEGDIPVQTAIIPKIKDTIVFQKVEIDSLRPDTSYLEELFFKNGLVNVRSLDSSIKIDLKYSDTNNFLKTDFYKSLNKVFLNCDAAINLCNAQFFLKEINPNYSLLVFDATRPSHIQKWMWDSLKMSNYEKFNYLSPPYETSLHNYGCAVDLTILDLKTKKVLDMGTEFDSFNKLSQPQNETLYLKRGLLSQEAYVNRILLRSIMQRANFKPIRSEWWHFSICTKDEALAKYKLIK